MYQCITTSTTMNQPLYRAYSFNSQAPPAISSKIFSRCLKLAIHCCTHQQLASDWHLENDGGVERRQFQIHVDILRPNLAFCRSFSAWIPIPSMIETIYHGIVVKSLCQVHGEFLLDPLKPTFAFHLYVWKSIKQKHLCIPVPIFGPFHIFHYALSFKYKVKVLMSAMMM